MSNYGLVDTFSSRIHFLTFILAAAATAAQAMVPEVAMVARVTDLVMARAATVAAHTVAGKFD